MALLNSDKDDVGPAGRVAKIMLDRRLGVALLYAVLTAATLYPVFRVDIPVLIDLPNHLSRMHLLREIPNDPHLQSSYVLTWGLLPNLGMDVFVTFLTRFLPVLDAARLFIGLTIAVVIAGTLALSFAVHGRLSVWQTGVFLIIYNQVMAWGFVNFLFGVGIVFLAMAGWILLPRQARIARCLVFSVIAVALFFIHLLALAVFGLLVVCYESWQTQQNLQRPVRDLILQWMVASVPFAIPFLLWIFQSGGGVDSGTNFVSPGLKLLALLAPFRFFFERVDQATIVFSAIVLIMGMKARAIRVAPAMRWALFAFMAITLLTPHLLFGIFAVDQRMAVVTALLAVAAVSVDLKSFRAAVIVAICAGTLFTWRIAAITMDWQHINAQYSEFRRAAAAMHRGAHLLVATRPSTRKDAVYPVGSNFVFWHLASLAVIDRSAFIPLTFTTRYQPIKVHPGKSRISSPEGQPLTYDYLRRGAGLERPRDPSGNSDGVGRMNFIANGYWDNWPRHFDYVLVLDYGERENPVPEFLEFHAKGSFFTIYRTSPNARLKK